MSEIMTKDVRAALNDPAKRFLLVDAYLVRCARGEQEAREASERAWARERLRYAKPEPPKS